MNLFGSFSFSTIMLILLNRSGFLRSGLVRSGLVRSGKVRSGFCRSGFCRLGKVRGAVVGPIINRMYFNQMKHKSVPLP
jgi:hypothetical protein